MPTLDRLRGELAYSSRIGAALLDVLAESGDFAGRTRALRALGTQGSVVHRSGHWLGAEQLTAMFRTAEADERLARRVGQTLVRPDGVGLALCYSGLATTEKAYRRSHHLLARESADAEYEPKEIDGQRGLIRFHPAAKGDPSRPPHDIGRLFCSARAGMLEAMPMLYGLVPARVRENECAYAGAPYCQFEVTWSRTPRVGLVVGGLAGLLMAGGMVLGVLSLGWPPLLAGLAAPALVVLSAAAGRSIDLARQLEAVAGARRGHLALLDQLDTTLAERMDDLAKLGGTEESAVPGDSGPMTGLVPVSRARDGQAPDEWQGRAAAEVTRELRGSVTALRDALVEHTQRAVIGNDTQAADDAIGDLLEVVGEHGAQIERAAATLERLSGQGERVRVVTDVRELIERAVHGARGSWPESVRLALDVADDADRVTCDPGQIEYVIEQLLRNAAEASEAGVVRVSAASAPAGIEVAVEDEGEGIDPDTVDRVFDPFGSGPEGARGGLGLPVCFRIVAEHEGELRVEARAERGARVSFVLPPA